MAIVSGSKSNTTFKAVFDGLFLALSWPPQVLILVGFNSE